jgi:UDP-glucose 4-epimerase
VITWVVGGGGLLGSAVQRRCEDPFASTPVPWADPVAAAAVLRSDASRFQREAGGDPWAIVWAAGAATVSTSAESAAPELHALEALLTSVRDHRPAGRGAVFLTSSAGGVYAGSANPPFDMATTPVPLSPYGELKLAQERAATDLLADVCPLVVGRFSNLYGPGQNLGKLQGLISRLALSAVTRQPINIFVSLDTIRDYIYVDDAAAALLAAVTEAARVEREGPRMLVVASGQPATVGQVIRTMNQVAKRRVPVALGSHPSATSQSLDLRLVPTVPATASTPLPTGMKAVFLDILRRVQTQSLAG